MAISAVLLCSGVQTATANVPVLVKIENLSQGTAGKIEVTITHQGGIGCCLQNPLHFINIIEVDVDGKVQQFTYEGSLQDDPLTVELDLGTIKATSVVKVRAHCSMDGWGPWSDTVPVPELPAGGLVSVVALAATLLVLKRQSQIRR